MATKLSIIGVTLLALTANLMQARADERAEPAEPPGAAVICRRVHADLDEDRATSGCRGTARTCFFGRARGRGLQASTYFVADASAAGPATSPGYVSYSGLFEYATGDGVLRLRETGVVNVAAGSPDSGAVAAHQRVLDGTGAFFGASGALFVSGFNRDAHVVTTVTGELCLPRPTPPRR